VEVVLQTPREKPFEWRQNLFEGREVIIVAALPLDTAILQGKDADAIDLKRT
jgi:acyl CoA:acetate/3-ketoacid CoA transferase alpha subunit